MGRREEKLEQFEKESLTTVMGDLEKDIPHTIERIYKIIFAEGSGGDSLKEIDQEGAKKNDKFCCEQTGK